MPEVYDILNEVYESNVRRIADLCTERDLVVGEFALDFERCTSIEQLLTLSTQMSERTTLIDAEINQRFRANKKLSAQMERLP